MTGWSFPVWVIAFVAVSVGEHIGALSTFGALVLHAALAGDLLLSWLAYVIAGAVEERRSRG